MSSPKVDLRLMLRHKGCRFSFHSTKEEDSARPKYVHYAKGILIVGTSLKQARTKVELIERQEDEAEVPRKRQERPLFHLLPPRRNFCPGILIDSWSLLVQY